MDPAVVFLDLEDLDDEGVDEILSYIYPPNPVSAVELPWDYHPAVDAAPPQEYLFYEYYRPENTSIDLNVHTITFKTERVENSSDFKISVTSSKDETIPLTYNELASNELGEGMESDRNVDRGCASYPVVMQKTIKFVRASSYSETSVSSSDSFNKISSVYHKTPYLSNEINEHSNVNYIVDSQNDLHFENNLLPVNNELGDTKLFSGQTIFTTVKRKKDVPVLTYNMVNIPPQEIENKSNRMDNAQDVKEFIDEDINENHIHEVITPSESVQPKVRSFADVLKNSNSNQHSKSEESSHFLQSAVAEMSTKLLKTSKHATFDICDMSALNVGKYFYDLHLNFSPISLQIRGLINRSNWCYVNATLQTLLACSPLYRILVNVPSQSDGGRDTKRSKSMTPVIDSMVHLARKFKETSVSRENFKPGPPFQPTEIYDMLMNLRPHCLKGQQEDAEEFLGFLVNEMHEEMFHTIKNYAEANNIPINEDINGHSTEDENDEWQTIGAKQRGMITRKVVEHKTPISDLLGGQTVNLLTIKSTSRASVQPFFTLQLDIQAEHVNTLEDALMQMTVKEKVQDYTCAKTKQEVEAYCKVLLKKLPPVLILHLKRFVYDKDGGCKKMMKHTQYPMVLQLKRKELFSPEARKKKPPPYRLFAVMYHEGEEAVKGHYISDIYHHGCECWIRCDDRTISVITEDSVLSHSPPRVPYLLFYQISDPLCKDIVE